jgi:hypothetical protein
MLRPGFELTKTDAEPSRCGLGCRARTDGGMTRRSRFVCAQRGPEANSTPSSDSESAVESTPRWTADSAGKGLSTADSAGEGLSTAHSTGEGLHRGRVRGWVEREREREADSTRGVESAVESESGWRGRGRGRRTPPAEWSLLNQC